MSKTTKNQATTHKECCMHWTSPITAVALLLSAATAFAQTPEEQAREIFQKHQDAVVTAQLVVNTRVSMMGQGSQEDENRIEATATVISPEGLAVMSLSETDPSAIFENMMGGNMQGMEFSTEVTDAKLLLTDGSEVPARIVLRDKDLDLAFLLPLEAPDEPMAYVDMEASGAPELLDELVLINRLGTVANRVHSVAFERIEAIVERPRTFYIPGDNPTTSGTGSPAFTLSGDFVGVLVLRSVRDPGAGGGGFFGGGQSNVQGIILPAIDISEGAAQAPGFDEAAAEDASEEAAAGDAPTQEVEVDTAPAE